jgi:hypothetical protein
MYCLVSEKSLRLVYETFYEAISDSAPFRRDEVSVEIHESSRWLEADQR